MHDRPLLVGSLIVVLAASGFGILGPLARFAYDAGLDPLTFVAWRAIFGLLLIVAIVAVRVGRGTRLVNPFALPVADRVGIVAVGLAGLGLNVAMFFAFDLTSIAITPVGCAGLAIATGGPFGIVFQRSDALAFAVIAGFVGAGIPSTLFLIGIRAIGGTRAGILMLFEPLVGVTLAALLLHEALTPLQALGGAAILAA